MTKKFYVLMLVALITLLGFNPHHETLERGTIHCGSSPGLENPIYENNQEEAVSKTTCAIAPYMSETASLYVANPQLQPVAEPSADLDILNFEGETEEVRVVASAARGVFPEGTEMHVAPVSAKQTIAAAQERCDVDFDVVDAVAADITFLLDGQEVQPDGIVEVQLYAKRSIEGDTHEAVTVNSNGLAAVVGNASTNMSAFSTDHFTVYAIVGKSYNDGNTIKFARYTYEFYVGDPSTERSTWPKVDELIVRDGDTLILPPTPAGDSKHPFTGWYTVDANHQLQTQVTGSIIAIPEGSHDTVIKVYAVFNRLYSLLLYTDETTGTIYKTYIAEDGTIVTLPTSDDEDFDLPMHDGYGFVGWKELGASDDDIVITVTINGENVQLVPVVATSKTVKFVVDYEGLGAADEEIDNLNVFAGGTAISPSLFTEGEIYNGYRFDGWYEKPTLDENTGEYLYTNKWNFNTVITEDVMLYAKWIPVPVTFTVEIWQEKQDVVGEYAVKYTSSDEENQSYGFVGEPGISIVGMLDNILQYETDKRDKFFHLSRLGVSDEADDQYAIEVWQDGVLVAQYDASTSSWISGSEEAVIKGGNKTVVRVYENRDTYRFHFLFRDGESGYDCFNVCGYTTVQPSHQAYLPEGLPTTGTLSGQVYTVRFKDNLYRTVYMNEVNPANAAVDNTVIQQLMDAGWYFKTDYCRKEKGQTVFNNTNKGYNLNPQENMTDGMDVVCLIYYNANQTPHPFEYRHYTPDLTSYTATETTILYSVSFNSNNQPTNPHVHNFNLFNVGDGYRLVKITTPLEYTSANYIDNKEGYRFTYDGRNANPMVLYYEPLPYHITFVPNDGNSSFTASNGAWPTVDDQTAFYVGDHYSFVINDANGAGAARYQNGYTEVQNGVLKRFDGWFDNEEFEGNPMDFTDPDLTMPNKNLNFYGKWTPVECPVVFHPNNGEENTEVLVIIGNKVLRIPNPEREGYIFGGWYTDADFTNAYDFNTNLTPTVLENLADAEGKVHLYAEWNSQVPYRILYVANGGSLTTTLQANLDANNQDTVSYRGNSMAEVKGVAQKEGHVFVGWRIGQSDIVLSDGSPLLVDAAHDAEDGAEDQVITLVAQYEKATRNTTLTYHSNYPEGTEDVEHNVDNLIINGNYTLLDVTDVNFAPANGQWQFVGWTTSSGINIYTGQSEIVYFQPGEIIAPGMSDNNLYAVWLPMLQISFNKVWGTTDGTAPEGASVTIQLYSDDTPVHNAVTTLSGNVWNGEFNNLPQYDENGAIDYTVQEVAMTTTDDNIYLTRIDGNMTDGFTIINTPTPDIVKSVNGSSHSYLGSWDEVFTYEITTSIPVTDGLNSFVITDILDQNLTFASSPEVTIGGSHVYSCATVSEQTLTVSVPTSHLTIDHQGSTVLISFKAKFKEGITYADLVDYIDNSVPNESSYKINNTINSSSNRVYVTPAVIVIKGEKSWVDNDNRAGQRPEAIIVSIMNGTSVVEAITCTPDANGKWEYISEELPVFNADGDSIHYSVIETAVAEYETPVYSAPDTSADGREITVNTTNSYVEEPVTISGTKTWDDEENIDGSRPTSIMVYLFADGVKTDSVTVSADANGNWSYSFTGLQRFRDGQTSGETIVYTVDEKAIPVAGYEKSINGYDITNSYTPERVNVPFRKTWNDNSDQDGLRPATVTFGLFKGNANTPVATQVVNAAENHHDGVFEDLLKKENGEEVTYSVKELDSATNTWITSGIFDGAYTSTMVMVNDTFAFTNTYTPEVVTVTANKVWNDDNNIAGIRPATLTFTLEQDGAPYGEPVSVNANDSWKHTWTDLPKYHDKGTLYNYSVIENAVENYTASDPVKTKTGNSIVFDFTNNYTPGKTSISVSKDWEDGHNQDGLRPESVQAQLLRKAENASVWENVGTPVSFSTATNWMHTFSDLDIFVSGQQGVRYEYSVKEVGENNGQYAVGTNGRFYTVEYQGEGNLVIRNSMTPEVTKLAVKKVWSDEKNRDGKRPASVQVQLFADGSLCREAVTLSAVNNWTYTYMELPKYNHSTTPIVYTVKEHKMTADGQVQTILANEGEEVIAELYTVVYGTIAGTEADTLTVTNTHFPETMTAQVIKNWEDENDHAGLRPASVSVTLKADDETLGTVTLNEENEWSHAWSNLQVFRANAVGDSIVYSVTEAPVSEYSTLITSSGLTDGINTFTITNTHELEYVSVTAEKVWIDQNDVDGIRPANIALQLYRVTTSATAQEIRTAVGSTVALNIDNNWMHTWTHLDKVLNGEAVVYVVDEVNIPEGYTTEITGNTTEGFTITNTHTPEVVTVTVSKEWNDANDQDGKRPATLTYTLQQNGENYGEPVTVSADDSWTHTWTDLPKHHDKGVPYSYTVTENAVTDYTLDELVMSTTSDNISYTFVNTHIPSTVDIPVHKVWNTTDETVPEGASVTLQLYADGTPVPDAVITLSGTVWDSVFEDLPEHNDGMAIAYTVQEIAMTTTDGNIYLTKTEGDMTDGFTFTNTPTPDIVKSINGGSHTYLGSWDEEFNYELSTAIPVMDGLNSFVITDVLDDNLTFASSPEVTIGGSSVSCASISGQTLTVTVPSNHLTDSHQGNPVLISFKAKFKEGITYADLADYEESSVPNESSYKINNSIEDISNRVQVTPAIITIQGRKIWMDNYNRAGLRPEAITVNIMNGTAVVESITCTPDASGKWEYTSQELPVFNAEGDSIHYSVIEAAVTEYEAPVYSDPDTSADGREITVNITNSYMEEPVTVSGTKTWNDEEDIDGLRPTSITVYLYADGENIDNTTVTADANGNWSYTFTGLQRFRDGQTSGQMIHYTVDEGDDPVEGYEVSINGYDITNTHIPDSIDLTVVKIWDDNQNTNLRSDVHLQLYRSYESDAVFNPNHVPVSGNAFWTPVGELKTIGTEVDTITATWNRMPLHYRGNRIHYGVKELDSPNYYTTSYTFDGRLLEFNSYTDTITNRHIETTVSSIFPVRKKLVGRDWINSDIFEMALIPERSTQPMPITVDTIDGIVYSPLFITQNSTFVNDSVREGFFGPITFSTIDMGGALSKTFLYHIRELTASESGLERILGITYGAERYEVEITVEFANQSLEITDVAVYPIHHTIVYNEISEYRGDRLTNAPMITNRYNDSVTIYHPVADKQLTIIGLADTLRNNDYHFMLKPVGENASKAPMPANTINDNGYRYLVVSNEGNAVRFFDDDLEGDGLRFDYHQLKNAGFSDAQLMQGIEFEYEMREIIPTNATYIGNGFWSRTVTNNQGILVDEIYDGIVHFREIFVRMEEIDNKVVLHVTSGSDDHQNDFFVSDIGDTTEVARDNPMFAQHHGYGSVPIFRNSRIARVNVAVEKIWDDFDNALGSRPEQITVHLLANGTDTVQTATLTAGSDWAYTFQNLPSATLDAGLIAYSVVEESVPHYESRYVGDMADGFVIFNTLITYGEDDGCTISVDRDQLSECPDIDCSPVTDDGITYSVVKIDGYCWMAENLRKPTPNAMIYQSGLNPNMDNNLATYGYLYTWHDAAGDTDSPEQVNGYVQGICPDGWHLPTEQEINVLMTNSADALRSDSLWVNTIEGANSTGFNALPAGYYNAVAQRFEGLRSTTRFHGDTPNSVFSIDYYCCKITPNQQTLQNGYSVRCVKDCE